MRILEGLKNTQKGSQDSVGAQLKLPTTTDFSSILSLYNTPKDTPTNTQYSSSISVDANGTKCASTSSSSFNSSVSHPSSNGWSHQMLNEPFSSMSKNTTTNFNLSDLSMKYKTPNSVHVVQTESTIETNIVLSPSQHDITAQFIDGKSERSFSDSNNVSVVSVLPTLVQSPSSEFTDIIPELNSKEETLINKFIETSEFDPLFSFDDYPAASLTNLESNDTHASDSSNLSMNTPGNSSISNMSDLMVSIDDISSVPVQSSVSISRLVVILLLLSSNLINLTYRLCFRILFFFNKILLYLFELFIGYQLILRICQSKLYYFQMVLPVAAKALYDYKGKEERYVDQDQFVHKTNLNLLMINFLSIFFIFQLKLKFKIIFCML